MDIEKLRNLCFPGPVWIERETVHLRFHDKTYTWTGEKVERQLDAVPGSTWIPTNGDEITDDLMYVDEFHDIRRIYNFWKEVVKLS